MKFHENQIIILDFKWYYEKGYITSRDGNACYRDAEGFVVTASGAKKNDLTQDDFIYVDSDGNEVGDIKPSIETLAHVRALTASGKNASVHVHSPNTVSLAALYEQTGGFKPNTSHLTQVLNTKWPELFRHTKVGPVVPFLEPGSEKLHDSIDNSFGYWTDEFSGSEENDDVELKEVKKFNNIVIMQRHGVLSIGNDIDECMEHIVRLEHVSGILLKIVTASGDLGSIL